MVLQQGSPTVWGRATPGRTIDVALAGVSASAVAGDDGRWTVTLPGLARGGPHVMTISGDGERTIRDVLVGEVWLGAGQSNMRLPVRAARAKEAPRAPSDCARIRLFTVERVSSATPLDDVRGAWRVCTPESVADFSAIAWSFGRDVEELVDAPVGLVVAAWGDTPIDVWLPATAAAAGPPASRAGARDTGFVLEVSDLRLVPRSAAAAPEPVALRAGQPGVGGFWRAITRQGSTASWSASASDPSAGRFAGTLGDADAWARATTPLDTSRDARDLTAVGAVALRARGDGTFRLVFGQASITDGDEHGSEPFTVSETWTPIQVPLDAVKQGGWGTPRPFARDAVRTLGFAITAPSPRAPSSAWNGMLAALAPLRLRGVLWYQGEADVPRAPQYGDLLQRLVRDWRAAWHADELPFLVVQLPGYRPASAHADGAWAALRDAQRAVLALPDTALVTTIDVGEPHDIHPKNKAEVARRLALAAARVAYGRDVLASGPSFAAADVDDAGRIRIRFADTGAGLAVRDADGTLTGFELSADGHTFEVADARITDASTIEVWRAAMPRPVAVRYAWADDPVASLVSRDGLPAAPFRAPLAAAATGRSPGDGAAARGSDPPAAPAAR